MGQQLSLEDLRRAWTARDPELPSLFIALVAAADSASAAPVREGALTFTAYLSELRGYNHRKRRSPQERARYRIDGMRALEAQRAEVPLPERLGAYELLEELWRAAQVTGAAYAREALLEIIAGVPLRWGPWRALKRIFKEAEARGDTEIVGALAARFDAAYAQRYGWGTSEVSKNTIGYLCRRAWRYLRRQAEGLGAAYADAAVEFLRFYPERVDLRGTWVYNHILFHETKRYARRNWKRIDRGASALKSRAYGELWRRSPRPLFTLLERANNEAVREYATSALKTDFRATLREVEGAWVVRLIAVGSASIDTFVIWLLGNVPRFEQGAFRELGLHDAVLRLLDSPANDARAYAAAYARTHARDLGLDRLIALANNSHGEVRGLVKDLLGDRDPRKDIGLDAWGRLLGSQYGHELAVDALRKHFGARELTPEWFLARFLDSRDKVIDFVSDLLPKIHPYKALGAAYFRRLLDAPELGRKAARFALDGVTRYPVADYDADFWRHLLLRDATRGAMTQWIREERVKADALGPPFWRALAFRPTWEADPWVRALKAEHRWARDLSYDEGLGGFARELLGDVRKFTPDQLGFAWLMEMVQRAEPSYHDFAVEYMIKAFLPADFAPADEAQPAAAPAASAAKTVDLGGKTFLFTGKLATMTRDQATAKVTVAGGANAGSVTAKLDYLVIGDEGSPLYGAGRKGSKQVAAEKLVAKGAAIRIISETAFLQMLAGGEREFSADKVDDGCARLWAMATDPGPADAPLASFAQKYIRRHHPDICLALTDRPVDPGAEIPEKFLTWARVRPLFTDPRQPLRQLALDLGKWELARWSPPIFELVALAEDPNPELRSFISAALLADDSPATKRMRVDPSRLSADAVYAFCESLHPFARGLGMELIRRHPRLAIPEELFRLSESPDRQVTGFVVRTLWGLYRDRSVTAGWKPPAHPPRRGLSVKGKEVKEDRPEGEGPPARPEKLPASHLALRDFMRRMLFTVPPTKPPKGEDAPAAPKTPRARPLPARKAKLALIEVTRDLAIRDRDFAAVVTPLIHEFMGTRGASERAACLVALARIAQAHPGLDLLVKEVA